LGNIRTEFCEGKILYKSKLICVARVDFLTVNVLDGLNVNSHTNRSRI